MPESFEISVVLPCRDYAYYLPAQLDAIEALTVYPKEVVFVDDGSEDASLAIWQARAEDLRLRGIRPRTIVHRSSRGLSAARNSAIERAESTWIMSVDPDDRVKPDCIAELARHAGECDVLVAGYEAFGHNGNRLVSSVQRYEEHADVRKAYLQGRRIATSCSPFRRELWREVGGYNEDLRVLEDTEFWLRCAKAGARFKVADRLMHEVRYHPGRLSFTISEEERSEIKAHLDAIARDD